MSEEMSRAIVIVIATSIAGEAADKGRVFLVPEDVSHNQARDLMRMRKPRAKAADKRQTESRLKAWKDEQAKAEADANEARELAAQQAADDAAAAKTEAEQIIEAAQAEAVAIIGAAKSEAAQIVEQAKNPAGDGAEKKGFFGK